MSTARLNLIVLLGVPVASVLLLFRLAVWFPGGGRTWWPIPAGLLIMTAYVIPQRAGRPPSLCFVYVVSAFVIAIVLLVATVIVGLAVACHGQTECIG